MSREYCKYCRFKRPSREEGKVWCSILDREMYENEEACYRFEDIVGSPEFKARVQSMANFYQQMEEKKDEPVKTNTKQQSSGTQEGCYIATAVYGSYDMPEVMVLRKFRDEVLKESVVGRIFIKVYYTISPKIAEKMKNFPRFNYVIKKILDKFVLKIKNGNDNMN